jgi:hypothetical protein
VSSFYNVSRKVEKRNLTREGTQPQNLVVFHVATEFPKPMEPDGFSQYSKINTFIRSLSEIRSHMLPFVPKNLKWSVTLHYPNENLALICISSVRAACPMTHVSLD